MKIRHILEGKFICLPDQTNGSCQWTLFGWKTYYGCEYKQKINEHLCIIKNFDGSKSTFLTKINLSLNNQYCLKFKYLITGFVLNSCMNFYAKTWITISNQSRLFSTFCLSNKQFELQWYSFNVLIPENITVINVVTDSNAIISNHSLIIKDLSIQQCHQMSTLFITLPTNLTTIISLPLIQKNNFWIRYRWIIITSIFILLLIIVAIHFYVSHRVVHQEATITERLQITPINFSQHFYEEPISIILQPSIDISVYDHVRDNYV